MENRCVCCGEIIPEGRMVCPVCEEQSHMNVCEEIHDIWTLKNHDYGNSFTRSYKEFGLVSSVIRLSDKLNRLKTLSFGENQKVPNESIRDTLLDLANYSIMTIVELDNEKFYKNEKEKDC